ncbi:hypothetical protein Thiosp_01012 [Thiorhodovibrio litoralis]|nr:hypothetical protein Thiosp_01012 [Thiorhodovibrio litoralis]
MGQLAIYLDDNTKIAPLAQGRAPSISPHRTDSAVSGVCQSLRGRKNSGGDERKSSA